MFEKEDHILVLKVFDKLPFSLGKKNFINFLKGEFNEMFDKNKLSDLQDYGIFFEKEKDMIEKLINILVEEKFIETIIIKNSFRVLDRTEKGLYEIYNKEFDINQSSNKFQNFEDKFLQKTKITKEDEIIFEKYNSFLENFNEEQKKAIVLDKKNILCIAGAGCGKTTVLTKRIEFLSKYKNIDERKILSITFTKKAKEEMISRLKKNKIYNVRVETFNSFCEKFLRKFSKFVYEDKEMRILNYSDKIKIINKVLQKENFNFDEIKENYFTKRQVSKNNKDKLFFLFINDIFSIIDIYKNINFGDIEDFSKKNKSSFNRILLEKIYKICILANKEIKKRNLRDFNDQINHTINFLEKYYKNPQNFSFSKLLKNENEFLKYEYILIDEYQDLNSSQFHLIKFLYKENIFAVGDPRQSIFGFRGSDIKFIYEFETYFDNVELINLTTNYRSNDKIIDFANKIISPMKFSSIDAFFKNENEKNIDEVFLFKAQNEDMEKNFICDILKKNNKENNHKNIFILSRTNKKLEDLANYLEKKGIEFSIKNNEDYKSLNENSKITLSTIHSIKGMEADLVILLDVSSNSYPNKAVDNDVLSVVKENLNYDKFSEELRLLYVGITRAKKNLILTYQSKLSIFLTDEILEKLNLSQKRKIKKNLLNDLTSKNISNEDENVLKSLLKNYRSEKAKELDVPSYIIFSNKTLDDLIDKIPKNKNELNLIYGLGPQKILKYGDDIIELINGNY